MIAAVLRTRPSRRQRIIWSLIAALLLLPALAMPFTREVNWTASDFAAAAIMLGASGAIYELAVSRIANRTWRWIAGAALLLALMLIWAQGAVGLF